MRKSGHKRMFVVGWNLNFTITILCKWDKEFCNNASIQLIGLVPVAPESVTRVISDFDDELCIKR